MSAPVLGHKALWDLGRALGLPDELPISAIHLSAECNAIVKASVELIPRKEHVQAVNDWLAARQGRVVVEPTVIEVESGEDATTRFDNIARVATEGDLPRGVLVRGSESDPPFRWIASQFQPIHPTAPQG